MYRLRLVSYALVVLGVVGMLVGEIAGAGPVWTLTGLLLAIAGAVKVVVVMLWRVVAGFEDGQHVSGEEAP